jgi:hypothetical protein
VDLESTYVWPIVRNHEGELGTEIGSQEQGQLPRCATADLAMQFVATLNMNGRCFAFQVLCQR